MDRGPAAAVATKHRASPNTNTLEDLFHDLPTFRVSIYYMSIARSSIFDPGDVIAQTLQKVAFGLLGHAVLATRAGRDLGGP